MSQKKHKKRHPQQKRNAAGAPAMESEFASDGRRKRMNRTARNLLLLSLMLVAAVNLLVNMGMMGQAMANVLWWASFCWSWPCGFSSGTPPAADSPASMPPG